MKLKSLLLISLITASVAVNAQQLKSGYISWGPGSPDFATTLKNWEPGSQVTADDNFFISRVKPKVRFRNQATQVRTDLNDENDKRLVAWIPIDDSGDNALPDGVYDAEVFSMWPYVTHWGDWSAPLGRVPGAFLDVAHKNGVAVSSLAAIPWGNIQTNDLKNWRTMLINLSSQADKAAQFLSYYGVDGLGYNSEFTGFTGTYISKLRQFHIDLYKKMHETNPLFENMWYDGTNDTGARTFDQGLGTHNQKTFGDKDNICCSLFFNYNWNTLDLSASVSKAQSMGRDPLYLYCGVNMQGGEPAGTSWPLLKDQKLSIGLWGAHERNMFWESRGEKGSSAEVKQRTYMLRTERWFTGGTRNPANTPEIISSMKYNADNYNFHGMSSFMTARSSLKWDLASEPFISYFNLGNGRYFNLMGERQNNLEWYNIGMQDYLPTWRWWFATGLLTKDVPSTGLDAEFTWDDAYFGGSCVRVFGSTSNEYLHLFKTEFRLAVNDEITVRYKITKGVANMNLVLTTVGNEKVAVNESSFQLLGMNDDTDEDVWVKRTFTVGGELDGKDLALIALHFEDAADLNLYLGEVSIKRQATATPNAPELTSASVLSYSRFGYDGKIIFNMPNSKAAGEVCYNDDVNTSYFKVYAQQEGCNPVLVSTTTSWAAMVYSAPLDITKNTRKVRFGVRAVSMDHATESAITWSDYMQPTDYVYNDEITIDKNTIKPGEAFTLSYVDPEHESGTWIITDGTGKEVFKQNGRSVTVSDGLSATGSYDVTINGNVYATTAEDKTRTSTSRTFNSFVQITSEGIGAIPQIYTLTADGKDANIEVETDKKINFAYTGRKADGAGSQGVNMDEKRFGVRCADIGVYNNQTFTVAFWLKINQINSSTQFFSIANKQNSWPLTDWGWLWSTIDGQGRVVLNFRNDGRAENPPKVMYEYNNSKVPIGNWAHIALVVQFNASGNFHSDFYINGVKQTPSSIKENGTEVSDGFFPFTYQITTNDILAIGGSASGRAGIDGVIDNFQIWKKALSAAEVKTSMGDLNESNLPSDLTYFWSFEKPATNKMFLSKGSGSSIQAGLHNYTASGGEGQGVLDWIEPEYTAGSPFIAGEAFPVVTQPEWDAHKGTVVSSDGKDQSGNALIMYKKPGDYEVVLKLKNALGEASRTFRVIKVGYPEGITEMNDREGMKSYTVGNQVFVEFESAGNYDVAAYNAAGQRVAHKAEGVNAGQKMRLTLRNAGVYVLRVTCDGKPVRSVKLIVK